jgi:hypothetical protein
MMPTYSVLRSGQWKLLRKGFSVEIDRLLLANLRTPMIDWFKEVRPPRSRPCRRPASRPAAQPPSHPATQPPSHPATQPPSHPATQPPSLPGSAPLHPGHHPCTVRNQR